MGRQGSCRFLLACSFVRISESSEVESWQVEELLRHPRFTNEEQENSFLQLGMAQLPFKAESVKCSLCVYQSGCQFWLIITVNAGFKKYSLRSFPSVYWIGISGAKTQKSAFFRSPSSDQWSAWVGSHGSKPCHFPLLCGTNELFLTTKEINFLPYPRWSAKSTDSRAIKVWVPIPTLSFPCPDIWGLRANLSAPHW